MLKRIRTLPCKFIVCGVTIILLFILFTPLVFAEGIDSYTKLVLHCNGTNGSTTFIDETGKSITANGNTQISTAQNKFGGASGLFDGTGDYLTTPDNDDWFMGTGNFTIDCWVLLPSSSTGYYVLCGQYVDPGNFWGFIVRNNGLTFGSIHTPGWDVNFSCSFTAIVDTWYHIAVVRNGNTWYMFINGVSKTLSLTLGSYSASIVDFAGSFYVGSLLNNFAADFKGYIDELRVSKGIARWTSNFTPPTEEYTLPIVIPTVTSPTATSITGTTAILGANVTSDGGATIIARGTCWGTSANPTTNCLAEGGTSTGIFTHSRTGLPPATFIYYRGYATNSAGTAYSTDGTFTTLATIPTVTTQSATDITTTTATGYGTITDTGGASITQHGVCWSESEDPTISDSHTSQEATGIGSFTSAITGLTPGRGYYYRAYATNSIGTGYGEDQTFIAVASIDIDWNNGNVQTIELEGDAAFTFSNGNAGATYKLILKQGDGNHRISNWPSNVRWENDTPPTLSTAENKIDVIYFLYNGEHYLGSYQLGF